MTIPEDDPPTCIREDHTCIDCGECSPSPFKLWLDELEEEQENEITE